MVKKFFLSLKEFNTKDYTMFCRVDFGRYRDEIAENKKDPESNESHCASKFGIIDYIELR